MNFRVVIRQKSVDAVNELPAETRRIIHNALATLEENPYPGTGGDKERLQLEEGVDVYRLHIGRSYTTLYTIDGKDRIVRVHEVMTIDQAHKKYGRM